MQSTPMEFGIHFLSRKSCHQLIAHWTRVYYHFLCRQDKEPPALESTGSSLEERGQITHVG